MSNNEINLLNLINEYIACAEYSCDLLRDIYDGKESFLYAYKVMKIIPKEGRIGDVYYNFHGRGCYFEYPDTNIEIDFGADGRRCDGFDLFRIEFFVQNRLNRYPLFIDKELLKEEFNVLISKKIIKKHPDEPRGHLFYLSNKI